MATSIEQSFKNGLQRGSKKVASKATKRGSGNSKQGGPASKDKPTDFYGPGGMLPTSKIKA